MHLISQPNTPSLLGVFFKGHFSSTALTQLSGYTLLHCALPELLLSLFASQRNYVEQSKF